MTRRESVVFRVFLRLEGMASYAALIRVPEEVSVKKFEEALRRNPGVEDFDRVTGMTAAPALRFGPIKPRSAAGSK